MFGLELNQVAFDYAFGNAFNQGLLGSKQHHQC
jgi:hypothetical protein